MRTDLTKAALVRRRFARRPEEVAAARRFVRGGLTRGSEAWEMAQLLVSETVTSSLDQSTPDRGSGTLEVGYAVVGHRLLVEVSDDGVGGVDPSAGSGIRGLQDRVAAVDGKLTIASPPGGGTRVCAAIPLAPSESEDGLAAATRS